MWAGHCKVFEGFAFIHEHNSCCMDKKHYPILLVYSWISPTIITTCQYSKHKPTCVNDSMLLTFPNTSVTHEFVINSSVFLWIDAMSTRCYMIVHTLERCSSRANRPCSSVTCSCSLLLISSLCCSCSFTESSCSS